MHIFIIGPTASGKTTIGKKLAKFLNMNFIDTDKEIEKSTGVNINWLFDIEGEEGFRKVKELPQTATSKDGRPSEQLSDDIFGAVSIESYTGITRGEGLSVVATVENGTVVSLSWN